MRRGVAGYNEAGSDLWFGIVGPAGHPEADRAAAERES
jgi:hypothetical protein